MIDLFLNLALGAATVISPAIPLLASETYHLPKAQEQVVTVVFKRHWTASDSHCTYHGHMVPYVRTWSIMQTDITGQGTELPPNLEEIAGYGIVITRRLCGEALEDVFFAGNQMPLWHGKIPEGLRVDASNIAVAPAAQRPEWLSQAVDVINRAKSMDIVIPPLPDRENRTE